MTDPTLNEKLKNKNATVVAIDPSGPVRQLLTDVLRGAGFDQVQGIANIKDTLNILEVEPIDWIITPLLADQEVNAIQLLKIISQTPELKGVRVTLLLDEDELKYLPEAFELGLMSWFEKPFNKDSITSDINRFIEKLEQYGWETTRVAGSLFSQHLTENEQFESQLILNESLLNIYPGDSEFLLNKIEPLRNAERIQDCLSTLKQVELIDESKKDKIKEIRSQILEQGEIDAIDEDITSNILDLQRCVVIDPDSESRNEIVSYLKDIGCPHIKDFEDGEDAWKWLSEQNDEDIDIIFQEWRIPSLTGPYFVQRVRSKFPMHPIVVVSNLIEKEDATLLYEMGIASLVHKPVEKEKFMKNLIQIVSQERAPTEANTLERKIRQALSANNITNARQYFSTYQNDSSIPKSRKAKIEAEFAYYNKDFENAKMLAISALRNSPDSLMILNLLGKILMALRDFAAALRCLQKAQSISPKNIARLCTIAEVQAEQNNDDEAQEQLNKAKRQDEDSEVIEQGSVKVALASGDTDKARELMEKMGAIQDLISYMNNKAISFAKCGYYEEGLDEYKKTLSSIPEKRKDVAAIVWYNMSLTCIRQKDQTEALDALEKAIELGKSKILSKAKSLKTRIEEALIAGKVVELKGTSEESQSKMAEMGAPNDTKDDNDDECHDIPSEVNRDLVAKVVISPGSLCLFSVFENPFSMQADVKKWIKNLPRFNPRDIIRREESRGVDKMIAG